MEPGVFPSRYQHWPPVRAVSELMIMKDITVVETNYTDYAVVLKYKKMDKEYTQVALYALHPTPPEYDSSFDEE
ncbi:hypothetical protein NFI96_004736, partial [Prochilodus magdalenae]